MVKIIMLNGFHGSGKDTAGQLIMEHHKNYKRYAFADIVKDIAAKRYGFSRELADMPSEKDKTREEHNGLSIRDMGRAIWMEIYATNKTMVTEIVAENMLKELEENPAVNFVITDFRYDHDYHKLVEIFGREAITTIKIIRDCVKLPDKIKEPEEYALENFVFDNIISNNGTYDELYNHITVVVHL